MLTAHCSATESLFAHNLLLISEFILIYFKIIFELFVMKSDILLSGYRSYSRS